MLTIPELPSSTMLLCEVGSTAHGTGLPGGEDHDEMGVVIESRSDIFTPSRDGVRSKMYRTQPEGVRSGPGDTDRTLHPLRKFLSLAAKGNPSILMLLWAPVLGSAAAGRDLRRHADWFVARSAIPAYQGYMQAQGMRLLGMRGGGHGRRGGGNRTELIEAHGYDTKYAMHAARLGLQGVELMRTGKLTMPIAGEPGDWLRAVRRGEVPFCEWWDRCLATDAELAALRGDTNIPPTPDVAKIAEWSADTHSLAWTVGVSGWCAR